MWVAQISKQHFLPIKCTVLSGANLRDLLCVAQMYSLHMSGRNFYGPDSVQHPNRKHWLAEVAYCTWFQQTYRPCNSFSWIMQLRGSHLISFLLNFQRLQVRRSQLQVRVGLEVHLNLRHIAEDVYSRTINPFQGPQHLVFQDLSSWPVPGLGQTSLRGPELYLFKGLCCAPVSYCPIECVKGFPWLRSVKWMCDCVLGAFHGVRSSAVRSVGCANVSYIRE